MEYIQTQAYAGFMLGAVVMASIHNMFLALLLYKTRQTNMSNFIKILFNFGNVLRFSFVWGTYMTPSVVTLLQCRALQYAITIGNVITKASLTAFLLWRLKQIHDSKLDDRVGIILFTIRAGFGVAQIASQRPTTRQVPDSDVIICEPVNIISSAYTIASNIVEFIIDIYVTIRLVQILRKANKNAELIASNIKCKNKRSLFTSVIYWNFLRLFAAAIFHTAPLFNYFPATESEIGSLTLVPVINIILAYVITVDAEIVRVIEGRNPKKDSSAGTEKSSKNPRTRNDDSSSSDLPKYSHDAQSTQTQSTSDNYTHIDEDKIAVVSMKRLSFFEWANFIVGNRLLGDNEEQYEEGNVEKTIDKPSIAAKEDLEKGYTTFVSTTDEDTDTVIE